MKNKQIIIIIVLIFVNLYVKSQNYLTNSEIKTLIIQEVDKGRTPSLIVGTINKNDEFIFGYGKPFSKNDNQPNENTIYEIGSITKIFVTTIFADMILKNEIGLNDPISKFLPDTLSLPKINGQDITLKHLATHTSGFDKMPKSYYNLEKEDAHQFYKNFDKADMYKYLNSLNSVDSSRWEYSNVGISLLAHILCLKEKCDFNTLIQDRICKPLNMTSTTTIVKSKDYDRYATPYIGIGREVAPYEYKILEGAITLKSTTSDLLKFLKGAFIDDTDINKAVKYATKIQIKKTKYPHTSLGLGWFIYDDGKDKIYSHGGKTSGFISFIGYDETNNIGIVLLSNSLADIDDIALHILNKDNKIKDISRKIIEIDDTTFNKVAGKYLLSEKDTIIVDSKNKQYYIHFSRQGDFEMFPTKENKFYVKTPFIDIFFEDFQSNHYNILIIDPKKRNIKAKRIIK